MKEAKKLSKVFESGSREEAEKVIKADGYDVNKPLNSGTPFRSVVWSPLLYACRNLNFDVIQLLLENKANVEFCANDGMTPIMAVVLATDDQNQEEGLACAKLLINADVSIPDIPMMKGQTVLTQAIQNNSSVLFDYFLEEDFDPNQRNEFGVTPLNFAVSKNFRNFVKCLQRHDANPFVKNVSGVSCLDLVTGEDSAGMQSFLISWMKVYYKEKFGEDKGRFLKMYSRVNEKCIDYEGTEDGKELNEKFSKLTANSKSTEPDHSCKAEDGTKPPHQISVNSFEGAKYELVQSEVLKCKNPGGDGAADSPIDFDSYVFVESEDDDDKELLFINKEISNIVSQLTTPQPIPPQEESGDKSGQKQEEKPVEQLQRKKKSNRGFMLMAGAAVMVMIACKFLRKFKTL